MKDITSPDLQALQQYIHACPINKRYSISLIPDETDNHQRRLYSFISSHWLDLRHTHTHTHPHYNALIRSCILLSASSFFSHILYSKWYYIYSIHTLHTRYICCVCIFVCACVSLSNGKRRGVWLSYYNNAVLSTQRTVPQRQDLSERTVQHNRRTFAHESHYSKSVVGNLLNTLVSVILSLVLKYLSTESDEPRWCLNRHAYTLSRIYIHTYTDAHTANLYQFLVRVRINTVIVLFVYI